MYSKGLNHYAYVSGGGPLNVLLQVEGESDQVLKGDGTPGKIQTGHHELEGSWLNPTGTKTVRMIARSDERRLVQKFVEIRPLTGNVTNSDVAIMLGTKSEVGDGFAVSYGFFDAPSDKLLPGSGGTSQFYMHVTDNYSNWMGDLARAYPQTKSEPFRKFVLPQAHDAGMFTGPLKVEVIEQVLREPSARQLVGEKLREMIGSAYEYIAGVEQFLKYLPPDEVYRALINFAFTQKDDIKTQLALGVRAFDFRPGYNWKILSESEPVGNFEPLNDRMLRHQHGMVPGYGFQHFLYDVVSFLDSHPGEIVVLDLSFNGFQDGAMRPSDEEVNRMIDHAVSGSSSGLKLGNGDDYARSYGELIASKKRLLRDSGPSVSSYNDDDYRTDNPDTIIKAIDKLLRNRSSVRGKSRIVLDLQATFTNKPEGQVQAVRTRTEAGSPLLYTKCRMDTETYKWLAKPQNLTDRCGDALVLLNNDFIDNALVSLAITNTKQRMGFAGLKPK